MTGIGEILRTTREKQGLTLQDVALRTYIAESYLEALEKEDFSAIPGMVYAKGFLRNYGDFLGLSGVGLVDRWSDAYDDEKRPVLQAANKIVERHYLESPTRVEYLGRKRVRRARKRSWNRTEWTIILVGFLLIIVTLAWVFWL